MPKLTIEEREELKTHVIDAITRRLTALEMAAYVHNKMGIKLSTSYLKYVRCSIRKDSFKQLQTYQKDRVSFLEEVYMKPVDELKLLKRTLHQIIQNEGEDTEVRIKAINQLQSVNTQMLDYYNKLPQVMGIVATAIAAENTNNNNSTRTTTTVKQKHPDGCNCTECYDPEAKF